MKRASVVVVVLALLLVAAPGVMAKTTVTVNPLGFILGAFSVEYETEFGRGPLTLGVPVMFWSVETKEVSFSATGFGAGVRYYLEGVPHDGVYVGAYASYVGLSGTGGGKDFSGSALGVSGVAGYKFHVQDNFIVDVGVGVGFPVSTNLEAGTVKEEEIGGTFGTSFSVGLGVEI